MPLLADLHTHTIYSDGVLTPEALLTKAAERGIKALSITDHDTVAGVQVAIPIAEALGVEFITGIEMSAFDGEKEFHILGYCIDIHHPAMQRYTEDCRQRRYDRAIHIIDKLQRLAVDITMDEVIEYAAGGMIGRQHIAELLIQKKNARSIKEVFDRFLGEDCPGYVPKWIFSVESAVALIHAAGGLAVLAHPGRALYGLLLVQLVKSGLDGIETIHPSHDAATRLYYERFARAYHLITTGGSDYHGNKLYDEGQFGKTGMDYSALQILLSARYGLNEAEW